MHESISHVSTGTSFSPEENPFQTVVVDITHRCNMECSNCYVPNRDIPDLDAQWFLDIIKRFPNRTRVRLIGGEPTVRKDLEEIVSSIRKMGHLPVLCSNGLKLANRSYSKRLKSAGLRTLHMSMNGGLEDALYEKVDDMACAERKLAALDVLCEENFFVTLGMIVVPGVNDHHVVDFFKYVRNRPQVREFHLRNVGPMGRYTEVPQLSFDGLVKLASEMTGLSSEQILAYRGKGEHYIDFSHDGIQIQLTDWPDLGNTYRGRLTPEGFIEPFMEHVIANQGGY
ncbi:MAG: radical SAM protein [Candidatus Sedimenticola sp. 6PFRAG7]